MSGGVDSSTAAYLLQQEGYAVSGLFITIMGPPHIPCTAKQDKQDAMRACATLNIPFLEFNATEEYRKHVIEPFVAAYKKGETPNPDVLCNRYIKFKAAHEFLRKKGFERIATGHYARIREKEGKKHLYQSVDEEKDQTYFIYALQNEILDTLIFPIGGYTKKEVRRIAESVKLPAAKKPDSIGLCFLGTVSMKEFLSEYLKPKKGKVQIAGEEKIIGEHDGAWFFTVGQRHGFTVTGKDQGPYRVIKKNMQTNTLIVKKQKESRNEEGEKTFRIKEVMLRREPKEEVFARYRHRGAVCPVVLETTKSSKDRLITFKTKKLIASGQAIVLYTKEGECLGGGTAA